VQAFVFLSKWLIAYQRVERISIFPSFSSLKGTNTQNNKPFSIRLLKAFWLPSGFVFLVNTFRLENLH
jgi:hypothetical protein